LGEIKVGDTLFKFIIEMKCPIHGFERFEVKVIKKFNMNSHEIKPRIRSRPVPGSISRLYVGRNVSEKEAIKFLLDHLYKTGLWNRVMAIRIEFM